jgi:hypothetical protein
MALSTAFARQMKGYLCLCFGKKWGKKLHKKIASKNIPAAKNSNHSGMI